MSPHNLGVDVRNERMKRKKGYIVTLEWKRRKSRSTGGKELYKYYYYREGQPPRRECNAVASADEEEVSRGKNHDDGEDDMR